MDHTTQIALGALAGLLLGLLVALINMMIGRRSLKKGSANAMTAAAVLRMGLDVVTLGAVYLLRRVNPLPFEPTIIGAALGLSLGGIFLALRLDRQMKKQAGQRGEAQ